MEIITLKAVSEKKEPIQAIFSVEKGLNLMSYQVGSLELIDQSTKPLFEERCAGLGALIGPHFHHRKDEEIIPISDETLLPHLKMLKEKHVKEPISHGIARYVPWTVDSKNEFSFAAHLSSKDHLKNIALSQLEDFDFEMQFSASLNSNGLHIQYAIQSSKPSVIGMHYYYNIGKRPAFVTSDVKPLYNSQGTFKAIPNAWKKEENLYFDLDNEADFGFSPASGGAGAEVFLTNQDYKLKISYKADSEDHSWQLYHPKQSSFVCIEPLSAKEPRIPQKKNSSLSLTISIV